MVSGSKNVIKKSLIERRASNVGKYSLSALWLLTGWLSELCLSDTKIGYRLVCSLIKIAAVDDKKFWIKNLLDAHARTEQKIGEWKRYISFFLYLFKKFIKKVCCVCVCDIKALPGQKFIKNNSINQFPTSSIFGN